MGILRSVRCRRCGLLLGGTGVVCTGEIEFIGLVGIACDSKQTIAMPRFINRTPLVCRPALRTCFAAVRITPPTDVIAYSSSSSSTMSDRQGATLDVVLDSQYAFTAATLCGVLLDGGPLRVAPEVATSR